MNNRASYNWECNYIENGQNRIAKGICVYSTMNYTKRMVQNRFRGMEVIGYRVALIR